MSPRVAPQHPSRLSQRVVSGIVGLAVALLAPACASTRTLDALEQARAAVVRAENSAAGRYATDQLMVSVKTLGQAEAAYCDAPNANSTADLAVRAQKQAEDAIARGEAARAREQQAAPASLHKVPMKPASPAAPSSSSSPVLSAGPSAGGSSGAAPAHLAAIKPQPAPSLR